MRGKALVAIGVSFIGLNAFAYPKSSEEKIVSSVCESSKPILVMDNFTPGRKSSVSMDVDGDREADLMHGEVVNSILLSSGRKTIPLNMKGDSGIDEIAELLTPLVEKIEAGEVEIAAINLSQTVDVSLEAIRNELGIAAAAEDFLKERTKIRNSLVELMDSADSPAFGELSRLFERLEKKGIPVFIAAGNHGPGQVNLLGFLPSVISVGALATYGQAIPTSADNSLVTVWRLGEHVFRRLPDGRVGITGDERGAIAVEKLTGKAGIGAMFTGKAATELATLPDDELTRILSRESEAGIQMLLDRMPDGIYPTESLIEFFKLEGKPLAQAFRKRGEYMDKTMRFPFKNAGGKFRFDPAGDGSEGQLALINGTSFAAPAICL